MLYDDNDDDDSRQFLQIKVNIQNSKLC